MRIISLEDHFLSAACRDVGGSGSLKLHQFPTQVVENFLDIGAHRIKAMDEGRISLQVVSHGPFVGDISVCRRANDQLAKAMSEHPGRFAGFAMLPVAEPTNIPGELERTVREYGFLGALIPNHADGTYYDGSDYYAMFEKAQELDVVIYIHPCPASPQRLAQFQGNYSKEAAFSMSTHVWDWHADTGVHMIRLYASGLFDRFPNLKIIIGHMGEMIPFMLPRIEKKFKMTGGLTSGKSFRQVYDENIWITTSGMFEEAPLICALKTTKPDRILFSVDYPFEHNKEATDWLNSLEKECGLSKSQVAKISYQNAEALLKIKLPQ